MSVVSHAPAAAQCGALRLVAIAKHWRAAYVTWRTEQAAIRQLASMSDGELKDIGLTRSEIERAVAGGVPRKRTRPIEPNKSQ